LEEPSGPNTTVIVIRLFDGTRIKRRFNKDDTISFLYEYVLTKEKECTTWKLIVTHPKRELKNNEDTIEQQGLANESVFVEEILD